MQSHVQSSFSLLPCKHSQMHEEREQLKIDCTCMDVSLYKPLNPGQPNLYHLLGSVGGWTMTSGSVHWCSCCHWSSEAIRKHMWSIRALPSTQIHAAIYVKEPTFNLTWDHSVTVWRESSFAHACGTSNQFPGHVEPQPLLTKSTFSDYGAHLILMAANYNSQPSVSGRSLNT